MRHRGRALGDFQRVLEVNEEYIELQPTKPSSWWLFQMTIHIPFQVRDPNKMTNLHLPLGNGPTCTLYITLLDEIQYTHTHTHTQQASQLYMQYIFGYCIFLNIICLQCSCSGWPTGNGKKLINSMLPFPAVPGCCLVSFHILWAILITSTVESFSMKVLERVKISWEQLNSTLSSEGEKFNLALSSVPKKFGLEVFRQKIDRLDFLHVAKPAGP